MIDSIRYTNVTIRIYICEYLKIVRENCEKDLRKRERERERLDRSKMTEKDG